MGTAREPVAGSGDWPAWTARVANCCCLGSDMMHSFGFAVGAGGSRVVEFKPIASRGTEMSRFGHPHVNAATARPVTPNPPEDTIKYDRPESFLRTRAVWFRDRLRLTHAPFESRTHGSRWHTHGHGPPSVLARCRHQGKYRRYPASVSINNWIAASAPSRAHHRMPFTPLEIPVSLTPRPSTHTPPPAAARYAPAPGKQTGAPFRSSRPACYKTPECTGKITAPASAARFILRR